MRRVDGKNIQTLDSCIRSQNTDSRLLSKNEYMQRRGLPGQIYIARGRCTLYIVCQTVMLSSIVYPNTINSTRHPPSFTSDFCHTWGWEGSLGTRLYSHAENQTWFQAPRLSTVPLRLAADSDCLNNGSLLKETRRLHVGEEILGSDLTETHAA